MSSITKDPVPSQAKLCRAAGCQLPSEVICRHCHEQYCHLCFMCHRKYLIDDMQSISKQMSLNRQQAISEVVSFINRQAKDGHEQARKLVDDAIEQIIRASQNISRYIENRRLAKLSHLEECLEQFDKDAKLLNSKLSRQIFLSADIILELRRKYAYNMFDTSSSLKIDSEHNPMQRKTEQFFENYRYYNELVNLRQKWTFLQAALTTVYFPAKKDITLDKILTFLEYRYDKVLENYREHVAMNEKSTNVSSKSTEELLSELGFISKKDIPNERHNFSLINKTSIENIHQATISNDVLTNDSGHGDDEIYSNSNYSCLIEDGNDYEKQLNKLDESTRTIKERFEHNFQSSITNKQSGER